MGQKDNNDIQKILLKKENNRLLSVSVMKEELFSSFMSLLNLMTSFLNIILFLSLVLYYLN